MSNLSEAKIIIDRIFADGVLCSRPGNTTFGTEQKHLVLRDKTHDIGFDTTLYINKKSTPITDESAHEAIKINIAKQIELGVL